MDLIISSILQHSALTVSLVVAGSKSAQNRWHSLIWSTLFPLHDCGLVLQALKLQYIFYKSSGFSRFINRWLQCRMHPGEEICCPFSPCHYLFLSGPDADVTTLAYLNNISRCCLHCRDGGTQIESLKFPGSERVLLTCIKVRKCYHSKLQSPVLQRLGVYTRSGLRKSADCQSQKCLWPLVMCALWNFIHILMLNMEKKIHLIS